VRGRDVLRPGELDDVGHGQEVVLVVQLGDERELMLNLLLHLRGHAIGPSPTRPFVGQPPEVARRGLPRRDHLIGVLVLQLVETEVAVAGNAKRLRQELRGKALGDSYAGAQMLLGVGLQLKTALGQRLANSRRRHDVMQGLPGPDVHVHIP